MFNKFSIRNSLQPTLDVASLPNLAMELDEQEQQSIAGGISPMLPLDLIRVHRNKYLSPGELDRIKS